MNQAEPKPEEEDTAPICNCRERPTSQPRVPHKSYCALIYRSPNLDIGDIVRIKPGLLEDPQRRHDGALAIVHEVEPGDRQYDPTVGIYILGSGGGLYGVFPWVLELIEKAPPARANLEAATAYYQETRRARRRQKRAELGLPPEE